MVSHTLPHSNLNLLTKDFTGNKYQCLETLIRVCNDIIVPDKCARLEKEDKGAAAYAVSKAAYNHLPNLKYPNSSVRFTFCPSFAVMTVLPTIIAPTQTSITLPNCSVSIGTTTLTFSP